MAIFKRRDDVVDLTLLQKKGILGKSLDRRENEEDKTDGEGYVDFSSAKIDGFGTYTPEESSNSTNQESSMDSGGDLFSSLTQAANASSTYVQEEKKSEDFGYSGMDPVKAEKMRLRNERKTAMGVNEPNKEKNLEVQNLKVKIEDLEYKLNDLIDRLIRLESRFD
jgi:hypothetical protein